MSAQPVSDLIIDSATVADVDDIIALEHQAFPSPWRRDFFQSELYGSGRFSLTARWHGHLAGYLFAMWFFDEMHINKIAVDESMRRQGIAFALMRQCIAYAIGQGVKTISLEVRQSNEGAQEFYRFLQFEPSYVRPRYYPDGEAAVVMTKVLQPS